MRKLIIAANWKMNIGPAEATDFIKSFTELLGKKCEHSDVVLAPNFVSLPAASQQLSDHPIVALASQNVSQFDSGAYTGETSVLMLKELFVQYTIIGHSERRSIFGETDEIINAKLLKARQANLRPIFCIGETLEERESGRLQDVLRTQLVGGLKDLTEKDMVETVIAYEPVWAIGTGVVATSEQAQEAHAYVRSVVAELYGQEVANKVRIQYGGSVKPGNAAELMSQPDIDGALVGGASLDPQSFYEIIKNSAPA